MRRRRRPCRPAARGRSRARRCAARTLRASACAQTAPNRPVEAPTTAAGLLRSGRFGERAREPVERVLELARDRVVVLGVETSTASASAIAAHSACTGLGPGVLVVLVERRDRLEPVEARRARPPAAAGRPPRAGAWSCGSRRAGCRRGRGPSSDYACARTRGRRSSLTSLASAKPPLGSGAFQLRPYSVRSTIASSSMPTFSTSPKVDDRLGDRAAGLDRAGVALDRQLAVDDQRAALGAHERRGEA